jgi:hypothetical protein
MSGLATRWRQGWSALVLVVLVNLGLALLNFAAGTMLPASLSLRFAVGLAILVLAGPLLAWTASRWVFPDLQPAQPTTRPVAVAAFSDEASAYVAVSVLAARGIRAAVSSGEIGQQSGIPTPVGGLRVLVASSDRIAAEAALAAARKQPNR